MLDALRTHFWWPYIFDDVSYILVRCTMCSKDNPIPMPVEKLKFLGKGNALFQGWSIDTALQFPRDSDSNIYLLVAIDLLSKWVEEKCSAFFVHLESC